MKLFLIFLLIFSQIVSARLPDSTTVQDKGDDVGVEQTKTSQDELKLTKENEDLLKNVRKQKQQEKKARHGTPYKDLKYRIKE